ncbi:MAG: M28 family peptidase [Micrococcus sp.]|nr:M28 family peptidase [Micrococcus sp.]
MRSRLAVSRGEVPAAYQHLERFQALAEAYGDRAAGTSGYEAAAQYVGQQLAGAGYQVRRQYFTFKHRGKWLETFNVLAETDAGSADSVIMLGAHLDGVPGCPAINDNGSGSAALIEAAKAISRLEGIGNTVRFAWWGAEEYKKEYGSRHYVRDLLEHDRRALEAITAYLNFDMIASPNPVIGVYDAHEATPKHAVPDGSAELMDVFTDYFDSHGQPWIPTDWDEDSDQVSFVKAGVAVGGLYTGDDEKKSPRQARLFGGTAKRPCDPNYHRPGDDLHNVDLDALGLMTGAITHAATRLAQDHGVLTQARRR